MGYEQNANSINVDASGFSGNLSTADTDAQKAFATLNTGKASIFGTMGFDPNVTGADGQMAAVAQNTPTPIDIMNASGSQGVTVSLPNGRFTIDTTGDYKASASVSLSAATADTLLTLRVVKNGTAILNIEMPVNSKLTGEPETVSITDIYFSAVATDTVVLQIEQDQTSQTLTFAGAVFSIEASNQGTGGGGAVDSVNTQTGVVVLDEDDINSGRGTIASVATTAIGGEAEESLDVTGTTTITSFGTGIAAGIKRLLTFTGILTLTHNGTSLILPTSANITTAVGDFCLVESLGSNNWKVLSYQRKDGTALAGSGGTLDFMHLKLSGATGVLAANDPVPYDTIVVQDNTNGKIALTADQIVLQPGNYKLSAKIRCGSDAADLVQCQFWDVTNSVFIGTLGLSIPMTSAFNSASVPIVIAYVSPSVATTYELRAETIVSSPVIEVAGSSLEVEQRPS